MINIAIGLFLLAALFGIYMASRILRNILPPVGAAALHGLLAASGLVLVLYAIYAGARATPVLIGAGLLVVAALGGFVAASFHLRKAAPPKALVIVHAVVAVAGVGTLLARALSLI